MKYDPYGLIDNESAFVKKMAWCQTGDKALSELLMAYLTVTYIHHLASMS